MATLTPTLTLVSTDVTTDELNFSVTDSLNISNKVIASNDDWMEFLSICQEAREHWGNSFSYTLIESKNIK